MRDARGNLHVFTYGPDGRLGRRGSGRRDPGLLPGLRRPGLGRDARRSSVEPPATRRTIFRPGRKRRWWSVRAARPHASCETAGRDSTTTAADGTVTQSKALDDGLWGCSSRRQRTTTTTPEGLSATRRRRARSPSDPSNPFSVATETATTETNTPDCALGAACRAGRSRRCTMHPRRTVTTDHTGGPIVRREPSTPEVAASVSPSRSHTDHDALRQRGRIDQVAQGRAWDATAFSPDDDRLGDELHRRHRARDEHRQPRRGGSRPRADLPGARSSR